LLNGMVNQTTRYALQILGYLARSDASLVPHEQIAREIGIPANYLSKILNQLRKSGIVESRKGWGGGGHPANYLSKILNQLRKSGIVESRKGWGGGSRLLPDAAGRPLLDIVRVFEGDRPAGIPACIFGLPECGDANPCPLHDQWTIIRDSFQTLLCTTMVGDLKRRTVDASREDLGLGGPGSGS
jgi:Rrf2 family iron-sulfur cluster assembly transcriptional regulator